MDTIFCFFRVIEHECLYRVPSTNFINSFMCPYHNFLFRVNLCIVFLFFYINACWVFYILDIQTPTQTLSENSKKFEEKHKIKLHPNPKSNPNPKRQ